MEELPRLWAARTMTSEDRTKRRQVSVLAFSPTQTYSGVLVSFFLKPLYLFRTYVSSVITWKCKHVRTAHSSPSSPLPPSSGTHSTPCESLHSVRVTPCESLAGPSARHLEEIMHLAGQPLARAVDRQHWQHYLAE